MAQPTAQKHLVPRTLGVLPQYWGSPQHAQLALPPTRRTFWSHSGAPQLDQDRLGASERSGTTARPITRTAPTWAGLSSEMASGVSTRSVSYLPPSLSSSSCRHLASERGKKKKMMKRKRKAKQSSRTGHALLVAY